MIGSVGFTGFDEGCPPILAFVNGGLRYFPLVVELVGRPRGLLTLVDITLARGVLFTFLGTVFEARLVCGSAQRGIFTSAIASCIESIRDLL